MSFASVLTAPTPPVATPPPGPRPLRWTVEEYYRLGELGFFDGRRVELVGGEIIEMSPQGWRPVHGCDKLSRWAGVAFAGTGWLNEQRPFDAGGVLPEPDLAVIPGRIEDYSAHPSTALLVVEVADATLTYDLTKKAELYATAGVPEYWVLDLDGRQLHVFRDPAPLPAGLGATAYRTRKTYGPGDTLAPLAAAHATAAVAGLLP